MIDYRVGAMKIQDESEVPEDKEVQVKCLQEPASPKSSSGPN